MANELRRERSQSALNIEEVTNILDGGCSNTNNRRKLCECTSQGRWVFTINGNGNISIARMTKSYTRVGTASCFVATETAISCVQATLAVHAWLGR